MVETHKLYNSDKELTKTRIWKGEKSDLSLGLAETLYVTIPRRHYNDLKAEISVEKKISAPIAEGQPLGMVNVTLVGETVAEQPLIALSTVGKGNFFQRIYDEALLLMK